jgi:hypothetical protein
MGDGHEPRAARVVIDVEALYGRLGATALQRAGQGEPTWC